MLVVHLVRFADGHQVDIFRPSEDFETLVNEDVVDQKVCSTVERDAGPDPHPKVTSSHGARDETPSTGHSKNQKERIVLFEESRFVDVVVFMEIPHQSVHEVFVRKPRHSFHRDEGSEHN